MAMAVVAYLFGSIPTGYLAGKAKGIDLRAAGSGNIGATNALRILGKPIGIVVLAADALKGFVACTWVCDAVLRVVGVDVTGAEPYRIVAGVAAVLGHNFTCWLRFKGGKGVATSAGVFLALAPAALAIALGAWLVVAAVGRYVSLASIAAAVALVVAIWLLPQSLALRVVATALGLLVVFKHRSNVQRLLKGTEHRLGTREPAREGAK